MKSDKQWPPSRRQRTQAARLGIELSDADTVHSAARKVNEALVAEADKRADLERRTVEMLEQLERELHPTRDDERRYPLWCTARVLLAEWRQKEEKQ